MGREWRGLRRGRASSVKLARSTKTCTSRRMKESSANSPEECALGRRRPSGRSALGVPGGRSAAGVAVRRSAAGVPGGRSAAGVAVRRSAAGVPGGRSAAGVDVLRSAAGVPASERDHVGELKGEREQFVEKDAGTVARRGSKGVDVLERRGAGCGSRKRVGTAGARSLGLDASVAALWKARACGRSRSSAKPACIALPTRAGTPPSERCSTRRQTAAMRVTAPWALILLLALLRFNVRTARQKKTTKDCLLMIVIF